jgi:hypothetical protein
MIKPIIFSALGQCSADALEILGQKSASPAPACKELYDLKDWSRTHLKRSTPIAHRGSQVQDSNTLAMHYSSLPQLARYQTSCKDSRKLGVLRV